MATPETRSFHQALAIWTDWLPAYLLTALFFAAGWFLNPFREGLGGSFMFGGVVLFLGISRIARQLGFRSSGIPGHALEEGSAYDARLGELQRRLQLPVDLRAVDIGDVPLVEAGGMLAPVLWVSTHTLDRLSDDELHVVAFQRLRQEPQGCGLQWLDLLWLLPWPLALLLRDLPAFYVAAAVLFALEWLQLQRIAEGMATSRADREAVAMFGRQEFARAVVRHGVELETVPGSPLLRRRLASLDFPPREIDELLQD